MAEPVNLTTADLMAEIGQLHMELKARAAREDQLIAIIRQIEAKATENTQGEEVETDG